MAIAGTLFFFGWGCNNSKSQTAVQVSTSSTQQNVATSTNNNQDKLAQDMALSNPATVKCITDGGKFEMQKTLDGNTEGICHLSDGQVCEEWAYFRYECPPGAKKPVERVAATSTTSTLILGSTSSTAVESTSTILDGNQKTVTTSTKTIK